jgi:hypothetical protein
MHLRENHIIPEIIDEAGNVLPDGQYGELVITTIGADAMPLIRYRTGDFTRILPPCQCGSVTKRIDRVSRRNGIISIEELDSILFPIPALIDYRASLKEKLTLHCLTQEPIGDLILSVIQKSYVNLQVEISEETITAAHHPLYPGKRHMEHPKQK